MENQTAGQHYANRPGSLVRTLILMPAACIVYKPSIFAAPLSAAEELAAKAVADAAAVTRAFTVVGHFPAAFFFPEPVSNRPAALSARPLWRPSWYPAYYIRSFFGMGARLRLRTLHQHRYQHTVRSLWLTQQNAQTIKTERGERQYDRPYCLSSWICSPDLPIL